MSLSAQVASERLYFLPFREKHKKNKNKQNQFLTLSPFSRTFPSWTNTSSYITKKKIIVLILCDQIRNSKASNLFPASSNI